MANYYLDTSALVKCYVTREVGSTWVQNLTDRRVGNLLLLSQLALVEVYFPRDEITFFLTQRRQARKGHFFATLRLCVFA